jgi:hypothetical protein
MLCEGRKLTIGAVRKMGFTPTLVELLEEAGAENDSRLRWGM